MRKRNYLSLMLVAVLGCSTLYGAYPAFATQETSETFVQANVVSPVSGHLVIQNNIGKSSIYDGEINEGQAIPQVGLLPNQAYNISIDGDVLYFGSIVIDTQGKASLDLYTMENDSYERSVFSAIEYESEPNNSRNKANALRSNTVYGKIDKKNDKDFFKVTIPSSGDYAFVLDDIPTNKDYDLYLYNAKGKVISVSAGASSTEIIRSLNLPANEEYYLEVRGYNGDFDKTETYRLQYAQIKSFTDDHGNNREQATRIETDTDILGKIDYPKDIDYFTFTAPLDGAYSIFSKGNTDTKAELYDANGKLLAENDYGENWNFLIEYTLSKGSQYYVAVSHTGIGTGSYTLFVQSPTTTPSKPNAGNSFDTATPISIGDSKEAWLENSQDARYFVFTPTESGSYGFYTEGDAATYGMLYGQNQETVIAENSGSGQSGHFQIANTLLAGQKYYIRVTSSIYNAANNSFVLKMRQYTEPTSKLFSSQYSLLNKVYATDINVLPAWELTKGAGVKVAIADSGIDYNHDNLNSNLNLSISYNFVHSSNDIFPSGEISSSNSAAANGHGTHVAGIVAANGRDVYGVAPEASLIGYKVLGTRIAGNSNYTGSITSFIDAIKEAQKQGIKIMNCSFGGGGASALEKEAMENARDILFVISSGNVGANLEVSPEYPACYYFDHSLVVAAADKNGEIANYSNYGGPTAIIAPGTSVVNTVPFAEFNAKTGTSMAAPHVTGIAALVLAHNPSLTATELRTTIISPENVTAIPNLGGKTSNLGMANAFKAVLNDKRETVGRSVGMNEVYRNPFATNRDIKSVIAEIKNSTSDDEKTGNFIVKIQQDADINQLIDTVKQHDSIAFDLIRETAIAGAFELKANTVAEADQLVDVFNQLNQVIYAEPNYIRK